MDKKTYLKFCILFSAVYFFSTNGLAALPNLAIKFLLKEVLNITPAGMSYFQAVIVLAWVIKPLWGYFSDSYPIFGYRRKSYLIAASLVACCIWIFLASLKQYSALILLAFITFSYMAYAFQDVVTDGLMVESGKPFNLTGKFQSIQWSAVYTAIIFTALFGGYISEQARRGTISYQSIFQITAIFPLITAVLAFFLIKEEKADRLEKMDYSHLKELFRKRDLWLLAAFFFLWNFSPSFGSPFFYYSVDVLKFDGEFLGLVQAVAGFSSLIGAIIFGRKFSEYPIRKLLVLAIFLGVAVTLFYYIYFTPFVVGNPSAARQITIISTFLLAAIQAVMYLAVLNLAAKVSPLYAGGTVFAFLSSFLNLGLMGSDVLGGFLFTIIGLKPLILISALFSLSILLILPYLSINEELTWVERHVRKFVDRILRLIPASNSNQNTH